MLLQACGVKVPHHENRSTSGALQLSMLTFSYETCRPTSIAVRGYVSQTQNDTPKISRQIDGTHRDRAVRGLDYTHEILQ